MAQRTVRDAASERDKGASTEIRTRSEFVDAVRRDGIEFLFAMFVDLHGKPCAKLIPVSSLDAFLDTGAGFAGYAAGAMGQTPADPDLVAVPDLASYTPMPWVPGLAAIQCDPHVEGEPWPYAPRVILKRELARLQRRGMQLKCGVEPEYFLVKRDSQGGIRVADEADTAAAPCYGAASLTRMYGHLTRVSHFMNDLGWSNYASDHEDANGQFEQNFVFADALTTADRLIVFRHLVQTVAAEAGMIATFMPKPFTALTGSGLHVHTSLWDSGGDTPLFDDSRDPVPGSHDAIGIGLSVLGRHYVGGLLAHARATTAITCPTVNSYKRLGAAAPNSGATWAPSYATYGGNNRTHLLRVPEPGRVEHRGVDGSTNPYLAFTAILAAGLDGIDRQLDPGAPDGRNLAATDAEALRAEGLTPLPTTLVEAAAALEADGVLRNAFGKVRGGEYVDYFAELKRQEFAAYHRQVSAWEIDRYVSMF